MKKLIFIIILCYVSIVAQDSEPEPWNFRWGCSTTPRPFVLD